LCQFFRFQLFASLLAPSYCSCASQLSTAPRRNAVKPKLGMGLSVYVLVAILKKQLGLDLSLHQIPQILSVTVFEKTLNSRGVFQLQRRDHRYRALHPVESIRLLMGQHCPGPYNGTKRFLREPDLPTRPARGAGISRSL